MRLTWLPNGWKDYLYWQENDKKILQRVNEVIKDTLRNPYSGIGKPEPLKNNLKVGGRAASLKNTVSFTKSKRKAC